jgi:hypothetical protein
MNILSTFVAVKLLEISILYTINQQILHYYMCVLTTLLMFRLCLSHLQGFTLAVSTNHNTHCMVLYPY